MYVPASSEAGGNSSCCARTNERGVIGQTNLEQTVIFEAHYIAVKQLGQMFLALLLTAVPLENGK